MMNPEIKAAWIEDLESGRYPQTTGELRDAEVDHYCCLGVLCETMIRLGLGYVERTRTNYRALDVPDEIEARQSNTGYAACEMAGMAPADVTKMWKMNDEALRSFQEIAQYLREHPEV